MELADLIAKVNTYFLNPLIALLFSVAVIVFAYGLFEYVAKAATADGQEKGKQHILWGLVGMFIMISAFTLVQIAARTVGVDPENPENIQIGDVTTPNIPPEAANQF